MGIYVITLNGTALRAFANRTTADNYAEDIFCNETGLSKFTDWPIEVDWFETGSGMTMNYNDVSVKVNLIPLTNE